MSGRHVGFEFAIEPIVNAANEDWAGVEILARNAGLWSQDKWRAWYHGISGIVERVRDRFQLPDIWFSINVDTEQLADRVIYSALTNLDRHIVLEWTERLPRKHGRQHELLMRAVDRLQTLRANHGLGIAFDDMGHGGIDGYQRVGLLHPDIIKIDGHVLQGARLNRRQQAAVLRNLVSMARDINSDIVVEWVETLQDVQLSRRHQIDYEQGWWHGRYEFNELGEQVRHIRNATPIAPGADVVERVSP